MCSVATNVLQLKGKRNCQEVEQALNLLFTFLVLGLVTRDGAVAVLGTAGR